MVTDVSTTGRKRCAQRCLERGQAHLLEVVIGVDQNDVIVHHDTGQRNHPDTAHHDAKRAACDDQSEQHTGYRKDDRAHHHEGLVEAVELDHEDDEHQEYCSRKGPDEEDHRILLVLCFASKRRFDARRQVHSVNHGLKCDHLIVNQHIRCHIRFDRDDAALVHAGDGATARGWFEGHEVRDRDQSRRGGHAQGLKLFEGAFL